MKHADLIKILAARAEQEPDCDISGAWAGSHMVCVRSRRPGLASTLPGAGPVSLPSGGSARAAVQSLFRSGTNDAAVGLAALNSLLPVPESTKAKGQDVIAERGRGRRVAVVGHFPFVEKMGAEFASFDVLELRPGPGDLPAEQAKEVLPAADFAIITSTTITNGSLGGLLGLLSDSAFVLLLGPSTPFCTELFDLGVDALAGAVVTDLDAAVGSVEKGLPFKRMQGVDFVFLERDRAHA